MIVLLELGFAFLLGGWIYAGIELLWRRRTHWTMFLTGGLCFVLLYALATRTSLPMFLQCALGAVIITAVEFLVGCVVNLALGWKVWDYSRNRFNLLGQVCLSFTGLWFALSWPALLLAQAIHSGIFAGVEIGEHPPRGRPPSPRSAPPYPAPDVRSSDSPYSSAPAGLARKDHSSRRDTGRQARPWRIGAGRS